ncbi:MAG TPA: outer membrane lipoprotein-sorting protein [Spirochaetia bacterium]|nr:outer membrane lipoprotein-sorting protein [Spirochaetia bacterium]
MRVRTVSFAIAALLAGATFLIGAAGLYAGSAEDLLAQVDARRYLPDFSFVLQMTSLDGDRTVDSNTLWGFVKGSGSENRSLVAFADPASVRGRKMLMDGNIVYLLFPKTTNPIRLSPLQVLMGQASNGDVVRTSFSRDYDVASMTETDRDGVPCYLFALTVKETHKDTSYKRIQLWVEKATLHPLYAEFSTADTLLKKATYRDYRTSLGKDLPFVTDIQDAADPQKHTVMQYVTVGQKVVPETVFRRDYLSSWTPEQPK